MSLFRLADAGVDAPTVSPSRPRSNPVVGSRGQALRQLHKPSMTVPGVPGAVGGLADATDEAGEPLPPSTPAQLLTATLGALTLWIPTEIVAAYGIFITSMQPVDPKGAPVYSLGLWLVAFFATPSLLLLTAWAKQPRRRNRSALRRKKLWTIALLSPIAFSLWSIAVPNSAWNLIPAFREQNGVVMLAVLLAAGVFTLFATKVSGRGTAD